MQRPPGCEIVGEGIEHLLGPVLGVSPRDHHTIRAQQRPALSMQGLFGDHIELMAKVAQPLGDMEVATEQMRNVVDAHPAARPHRQVGPEPRRIAHSAAIGMVVVETQQAVLDDVAVPAGLVLIVLMGVEPQRVLNPLIGIRVIRIRGSKERHLRRAPRRRLDEERHMVFDSRAIDGGAEAQGVDAARLFDRHRPLHIRFPLRVLEVVVVEMNGVVVTGSVHEMIGSAAPGVAGDPARRHVHRPAMEFIRRSVTHHR